MQYKDLVLALLSFVPSGFSAYAPPEPWNTLTPSGTIRCGIDEYTKTFGIAIDVIATESNVAKRDNGAVSQYKDGQVRGATATAALVVSQIHDGQIQAPATKTETREAASQIHDGQVEAPATETGRVVSQANDGQVREATSTVERATKSTKSVESTCAPPEDFEPFEVSCSAPGTLQLTLKDGILRDEKGRIGSIVANHQFQFDGPPPQAGAIYAAGWSITPEGRLALGDNDVFYECLSGDFYNLYNKDIAAQCRPVYLNVVSLVEC